MTTEEQIHNTCKEIEAAVVAAFPEAEKDETYGDYAWNIGEGVGVRLWAQRARFTGTVVAAAPNIEVSTSYRVSMRRFKKTWKHKDAAHVAHILDIARKRIADVRRHNEGEERVAKEKQALQEHQQKEMAGVTFPAGMNVYRSYSGEYEVRLNMLGLSAGQVREMAALLRSYKEQQATALRSHDE